MDGLDKAYEARSQWITRLNVDRMFDPLRSERRFIALPKRSGARLCFHALKEDLFLAEADAGLLFHIR